MTRAYGWLGRVNAGQNSTCSTMMQKRVHGNTGVSKSDNSCIGKNENEEE